ncbi:MAG: hypothetical protein H7X94_03085 [Vallitaleaceae bacterium]|nr:hypothetical protein [Vallitaleaceae bacterium]
MDKKDKMDKMDKKNRNDKSNDRLDRSSDTEFGRDLNLDDRTDNNDDDYNYRDEE